MQTVKSENTPTSALALRADEKSASPAQFLLNRVQNQEKDGYVRKNTLLDLAKYILGSRGWSPEHTQIIKVLARYHLAKLANIHPRHRARSWQLIATEESKPYIARCMRCGLPISNPVSLATGHGAVCRRKLGITNTKAVKESEEDRKREQLSPRVKVGDIFYESWGYDQTNIDFLTVTALSPTGKTAICKMMSQNTVNVGDGYAPMSEHIVPDKAYGEPFRLRIKEYNHKPELAGSYPYCEGDKRPGYFSPWDGRPLYQSHYA
jgi:hypothetical protein